MFNLTPVVRQLLFINIGMFIASLIFGIDKLALYYPAADKFEPYQIVTHFFMHGGIGHLFFNMFALVMFGSALESLWGPKKFLFYYFFCAIGAAALHTFVNYLHFSGLQEAMDAFRQSPSMDTYQAFFDKINLKMLTPEWRQGIQDLASRLPSTEAAGQLSEVMQTYTTEEMGIPVVGASGAIYGLLLAFGVLFPNAELMLIFLPIPIKAKFFIPLLILGELYLGVNRFSWDNVAHFAHLGGALFGLLLILYWRKFDNTYRIN
jgi:membrane associated rhomboid family serine protease